MSCEFNCMSNLCYDSMENWLVVSFEVINVELVDFIFYVDIVNDVSE